MNIQTQVVTDSLQKTASKAYVILVPEKFEAKDIHFAETDFDIL